MLGTDASRATVTDGPPKIKLGKQPAKRKVRAAQVNPTELFAVVPAHIAYDSSVHPAAIRILIALAHHANMHGITHVSQARIARLVGIQRPTVCKHIATLAEHLYIAKLRPAEKGKRGITWRIIYDREAAAEYRKTIAPHIKGRFQPMNANKSLKEGIKKETKAKKESSTIDEKLRKAVIERYLAEGLPMPSDALIAESVADLMRQCPEIASESPTGDDQVASKGDIA
jgi:DNA-binding MarR family transcriptional regulator